MTHIAVQEELDGVAVVWKEKSATNNTWRARMLDHPVEQHSRASKLNRLNTKGNPNERRHCSHRIGIDRSGKRGARVNTISPGIVVTPLAKDELSGPRGAGYRRMIELSSAGRAGTPDEVGNVGALLMGPDGAFITGSDFLMDGGVTAAYWYGDLAPT
jgi:hypothetical protein